MNERQIAFASAAEQARWFRSGRSTPVEVVSTYLVRIERLDPTLRSLITVRAEAARAAARRATDEIRAGAARSPLHGIPFVVKDQMLVEGMRVTGGSRVLEDHVADRTATVVRRLEEAGAILLASANTHEFHAGPTRRPPYGVTRNPWNVEHSPGASSSGSAAAVAGGLCTFALGGDTGGSIRGPASFCNLVGLKPTWSRVSRDGVFPLSWQLDCVGPMTRSVEDAANVLQVIAGADPADLTASAAPVPAYAGALPDPSNDAPSDVLDGVRVGVVEEMMDRDGVDAETLLLVEAAVETLASLGASVQRVSVPDLRHAQRVANVLALADGASFHRPWLLRSYDAYDVNTRTGFVAGAVVPSFVVSQAARMRTRIAKQVVAALGGVDVLVGPAADVAGRIVEGARRPVAEPVPGPYRTPLPQAFNLAGVPAASVPCGFGPGDLPVGMTVASRHFRESDLLRVAHAYERSTTWHDRWPNL